MSTRRKTAGSYMPRAPSACFTANLGSFYNCCRPHPRTTRAATYTRLCAPPWWGRRSSRASRLHGAIVIILANGKMTKVAQRTDDTERLWVRVVDLPGATGWQMKPQGMCLGEMCVPLPDDRVEEWIADAEDWVWMCYSGFADMIGQKYVRDGDVWSLGSVPEVRRSGLEAAIAPDFELTERNGERLRLSDFRGRKVVLFTWASW
ncbi:MAG: redoxin domain-containing protein [Acidimicrobiia bacterium]|nr:redoxin domain-containing protein [Acidimicrobiia bacterium]MXX45479.1 redoxin domain-containing protein [Acidimicrobiia bacterium]MXY74058.1 redoxin domain-containing protein [Acidimicrobiia bacterium]MYA39787.1 redoxin domain-containing protein [Acidimicrobiia bacterium]MYB78807.1 redoxin domain-containing protein [Acidimicrobiia bacterium]